MVPGGREGGVLRYVFSSDRPTGIFENSTPLPLQVGVKNEVLPPSSSALNSVYSHGGKGEEENPEI